jgi:multidrug efflux pump subunit AcrA (membrane-fusion protein)
LLKPIKIGRDFGDQVEIVDGLNIGESIIINPPDSLSSGEVVRIVSTEPPLKESEIV